MIDKRSWKEEFTKLFSACGGNLQVVPELDSLTLKLFEDPLIGFASAEDPLFERFKEKGVIGEDYMSPRDWMPEAKTVVSFFFPFTEQVKRGEPMGAGLPSIEWLYGRIEGQEFLVTFISSVKARLEEAGIRACVPLLDERFRVEKARVEKEDGPDLEIHVTWSERHAAYVSGLGTFGLSKGLITKAGIAGRYASVIVDAAVEPDAREYEGIYDYCSSCGACTFRCPCQAISLEKGKNHYLCSNYLDEIAERFSPRYGCGLCQLNVPCESRKACG